MRRFSVKEMVYLTLGAGAGEDTILWMSEKALGPGVNWGNSLARQKMCAQLRGRSGPHHVLIPPGYIVLSCLVTQSRVTVKNNS